MSEQAKANGIEFYTRENQILLAGIEVWKAKARALEDKVESLERENRELHNENCLILHGDVKSETLCAAETNGK